MRRVSHTKRELHKSLNKLTMPLARLRQGLTAYRATGAQVSWTYYLALLADACGNAGHTAEGLPLLTEALALVNRHGEHFHEAELYRLKGELLLAHNPADPGAADTRFQQALGIARRQHAQSLELWAILSLARLWQQQGQQEEARALLAPISGWFTEGFDTADLQEAKALLEVLGT
jgi:predicted ATPase